MKPFDDYLNRILEGIQASDEAKRELYDEFMDHLEQLRADFFAKGAADEAAVHLAISEFGDSGFVGSLMNNAISPYRKWLRIGAWSAMAMYGLELVHKLFINSFRLSERSLFMTYKPRPNLVPLRSIRMYASGYRHYNFDIWFFNLFGNALLFVPLGFLLPILFAGMRKPHRLLLCSLLCSLAIELTQYASRLGVFDVDDLILNTAGGLIGFAGWAAATKGASWLVRKWKPQHA